MNALLHTIEADNELLEYPLGDDDRLDTHWFMAWERRRWLNSDMRMKGTAECRAIYFDLICISYDQAPIGTLPKDYDVLAWLTKCDPGHFRNLCDMRYGPLHRWEPCRCGDSVRLYHPFVLKTVLEALSGREANRARNEAANVTKRLQRLRKTVAGFHIELAKNDAAVLWMDEWLLGSGCEYRKAEWIEKAIAAWSNHMFDLNRGKQHR